MDLDDIAVYVKVVQAGSFSKAARLLDMPNTTVSAKVARLEKRLGVTLISVRPGSFTSRRRGRRTFRGACAASPKSKPPRRSSAPRARSLEDCSGSR